ncbi:PAS domain-containing methyl-accepting chemotaxis protein [Ciceribacter sp. L1K22]|uniref:methyl-accepting chemotaxis protein n=1 Tax=Ciceribacter sp. L1K22 TaxID=2820275 RepID=UPI001ABEDA28|nr:PAS domain-containing methyl-accepting chemotaxis protein [Ciceribacter sp. L1K22]MBO3760917.1 PAS domain-containing methyl-accepting chemotaxis protein [Ciceribacter sp. L1K22]
MSLFGLGSDASLVIDALNKSLAIIEFTPEGEILDANENFCKAMGYQRSEVVGKHHRMFIAVEEANSSAYRDFWKQLASGRFDRRQYKRFGKGNRPVWIEASYNPVMRGGKVLKVVKIATDITEAKLRELDSNGKIDALSRSQAVIEFTPTGEILTANENFLQTLGYSLNEIVGRHHSMFCEKDYARSADYATFWSRLAKGEFFVDKFARVTKSGARIHIQASYNPIVDDTGKVWKVVKFASDITARVNALTELGAGLTRLADCNIRVTIDHPFPEEFENLRHNFNTSIGRFQETLELVLSETAQLTSNSSQMRSSSESLAHRSEQQAVSLEQTSAALEQITETIRESTERTRSTRTLVQDARKAASESVDVVKSTVDAMGRIETASKEIGNIIDVIDEIAFQTNLLALNAGVEAARAGESGKGFAVVAQEVRELAQRSAKAAQEIAQLIAKSTSEVQEGVRLVGDTGDALNRIQTFVQSIDTNVEAIAHAAQEQSSRLGEINAAVNSLDQATQQNSAMVGGMTSVGQALAEGARKLTEIVATFKLNRRKAIREPGSAAAAAAPQRRAAA